MEQVQRNTTRRAFGTAKGATMIGKSSHPAYSATYSMYRIPPTEEVTIQEFETFALDRVKGISYASIPLTKQI
jgi:hypothetical protein